MSGSSVREAPHAAARPGGARTGSGARTFALDTGVVAVTQLLLKLRGLVTLPLIAKLLGTAEYGVYAQVLALVGFVAAVVSANLHLPLVRELVRSPGDRGRTFSTVLLASLAAALAAGAVLAAFAEPVGHALLGGADAAPYVLLAALQVVFANVRLLAMSVLRALGRLRARSALELAATFGELAGIVAVLLTGRGLLAVFVFMAAWQGIFAAAQVAFAVRLAGWGRPDGRILRAALRYSLPLLPAALSIWMLDRIDRFVVGYYLGPEGVGVYSAHYALATLLMLAQAPFQMTLFPKVVELWTSDRALARRYVNVSNLVFLTFAVPFVAGAGVLARPLLAQLANAEIAAAGAHVTVLLAAGVALWGVAIMQTQFYYAAGRTWELGVVTLGSAALNLLMNIWLVPWLGVAGAALATLAAYAGVCGALALLQERALRLSFPPGYLARCLAAAAIMCALALALSPARPLALVGTLLACVVTYFTVLWLLRPFTPEQRETLLSGAAALVRRRRGATPASGEGA